MYEDPCSSLRKQFLSFLLENLIVIDIVTMLFPYQRGKQNPCGTGRENLKRLGRVNFKNIGVFPKNFADKYFLSLNSMTRNICLWGHSATSCVRGQDATIERGRAQKNVWETGYSVNSLNGKTPTIPQSALVRDESSVYFNVTGKRVWHLVRRVYKPIALCMITMERSHI